MIGFLIACYPARWRDRYGAVMVFSGGWIGIGTSALRAGWPLPAVTG